MAPGGILGANDKIGVGVIGYLLIQAIRAMQPDCEITALAHVIGESNEGKRLVRAGITGFRNGDENIHFRHVNKVDKGRTCRACHEVHASKRPAHIREAVPFGSGGWLLDINFEQTEDGGSCAPGCHTVEVDLSGYQSERWSVDVDVPPGGFAAVVITPLR